MADDRRCSEFGAWHPPGIGRMFLCGSIAAILLAVGIAGAASTPSPLATTASEGSLTAAERSLISCDAVDDRPGPEVREQLELALALGEEAVAANDRDAKAHFAVFCNLAKLAYLDGFSLSNVLTVWRMRREIDTTLALDPNYVDAIIAKAGLLLNLPRVLGGDPHAAERLSRRAVELEPDRATARLYLAESLLAIGAHEQAAVQARHALAIAERNGRTAQANEARTLISRIDK